MQILSNHNEEYGYNAARDCYEDLMKAGIMDPSKVLLNLYLRGYEEYWSVQPVT